ncbi:MAG: glutathione S-transferase N-terminal domain-containing protein [Paracoccaceae bacterium]|nr:glutathione S-transferase N-terminal domain-containing protein [Paracoccaceae bacterium]
MLKFYYNAAPNPLKVALFLEEAGIEFEPIPIDTRRGDQHSPGYVAINPNSKVPAIDDDGKVVFDSNAILLYLAEKTGQFLPPDGLESRADLLSWLMFVATGVGPYSGQAVHFRNFAPGNYTYALKRYDYEARRHWRIVDDQLAHRTYMMGDTYTILDMAVWGWAGRIPFMFGQDNAMENFPNLARLVAEINARPAAVRACAMQDQHVFKKELDDEAMRNLYPQIFAPDPN